MTVDCQVNQEASSTSLVIPPPRTKMHVIVWPYKQATNPYISLLYGGLPNLVAIDELAVAKLFGKYSICHLHWPESLLNVRSGSVACSKVISLFAALDWLRMRGTKIVWTVHNIASHEAFHPHMEKWFWEQFVSRVDGVISLTHSAMTMAADRFCRVKSIPSAIIPHGHYRDSYASVDRNVRTNLSISSEQKVILFLGAIRPYKNVTGLISAFREASTPNAALYVIGQPNSNELAGTIIEEARRDSRVFVRFGFFNAEEVSDYIGASDLVVLPYREILNSGSALLALSCNRPVLVPNRGSMAELAHEFGTDWVRTYPGDLNSDVLDQALRWASQPRPATCSMPDKFNWNRICLQTAQFYEEVAAS